MSNENNARLKSQGGHWVLIDGESGAKSNNDPNNTSSTPRPRKSVRHPKFFFDNVLVAIEIEDTLFNVHKYQLAKSEVFSDMFNMPKPEGHESEEGSSPEHPMVIKGVAASDFAALLTVLYASHFTSNPPSPDAALIIPAFRLANMFDFSELRTYLLPLAEQKLDDVDKIVFAREFHIKEWLAPALIRICQRETVLSTEEANKLGANSVLLIWRAREKHRSRGTTAVVGGSYCQGCIGVAYYGYSSSYTCQHCSSSGTNHYYRYDTPGAMGPRLNVDNNALEAEVTKWVEDSHAER